MAANNTAQILSALATMQSNADTVDKTEAHRYLENFQKSVEAWHTTHAMLQDASTSVEARLFAATTIKGKVSRYMRVSVGYCDH